MDWESVCSHIARVTDTNSALVKVVSVTGGDINRSCILHTTDKSYFVKSNRPDLLDMFKAESDGLRELARAGAIRAPAPVCTGYTSDQAYSVMQLVELFVLGATSEARLGEQLAAQHRATTESFGWHRDNTIGSTPQINTLTDDWVDFFKLHRLGYQLNLAKDNGANAALIDKGGRLLHLLPHFFTGYQPIPSLLHGDLWRGNVAADNNDNPVIFDPAVYYGDREADIAMTELFGGFSHQFYAAYQNAWPLDPGYATRKHLYNLYHILNHYNLFGASYTAQAEHMIERLLSEVR